jgi:hypothetical protein
VQSIGTEVIVAVAVFAVIVCWIWRKTVNFYETLFSVKLTVLKHMEATHHSAAFKARVALEAIRDENPGGAFRPPRCARQPDHELEKRAAEPWGGDSRQQREWRVAQPAEDPRAAREGRRGLDGEGFFRTALPCPSGKR